MNDIRHGIFIGYTGTEKNVWYIDDTTRRPKDGSWVKFDEAHFSVPAKDAPIAAQTLQRLGYPVKEERSSSTAVCDDETPIILYRHSPTAKSIIPSTDNNSYSLPLDIETTIIKPNTTKLLPTGISCVVPLDYCLTIQPLSTMMNQILWFTLGW